MYNSSYENGITFEGIIFYSSLIMCTSLGSYYNRIEVVDMKKTYGTGLGFLIAFLICGQNIFHSLLIVWGNTVIIKCCEKRHVHLFSLAFTWTYLVYMHLNVPQNQYNIWYYQTLSLRLVGLAYEIYMADKIKADTDNKILSTLKPESINEMDFINEDPTATDIISYSYFFIGLHKGPYFRWKVYNDHFTYPFGTLGDCRIITIQKLKKALICGCGYLLLKLIYPTDFYKDPAFYKEYGSDFRYLYGVPQLAMYFLKSQMTMMLCTSVFTETGFGVYPAKTNPLPGHGPSSGLATLKSVSREAILEQEYNFATVKCFDNKKCIFGPKLQDTLRSWDMPTQYWFWVYTYKSTIRSTKEVRSAFSFFTWLIWRGFDKQNMIISASNWLYLNLELEYTDLYDTKGMMKPSWDVGFSIMRMLYLVYITPCLVIKDSTMILPIYNSIYWMYHILILILMLLAIFAYKVRGRSLTIEVTNELVMNATVIDFRPKKVLSTASTRAESKLNMKASKTYLPK